MSGANTVFLNIDSAAAWDSACPVLLPLGSPTLGPIVAASMGLFVPFFIFVAALFFHFYSIWTNENSGSSCGAGVNRPPRHNTTASFSPPRNLTARVRTPTPGFFQRAAAVGPPPTRY